ncbi:MAG: L,D-transpeptidase [Neisseriaceae bacterium]|nr:L,D-transpeptidase [Neisseriaceae bacterium]
MKRRLLLALICASASSAFAGELLPDVAPSQASQHIVVNIPQQRLFFYEHNTLVKVYPIVVGKNATRTPMGTYKIGATHRNPTWHVPQSIQKEMRAKGQTPIQTIAPGPNNPLGPVFIRFGDPKLGLGIHGTNAPSVVPGVRSHGCVRMKSPEALEVAAKIERGADVSVIYQMASLNQDAEGKLWLAAYKDPYGQKNLDQAKLLATIQAWATETGKPVNQALVTKILANQSGLDNCISCLKNVGKNSVSGDLSPLNWTDGLVTRPPVVAPAVIDAAPSEAETPSNADPDADPADQEAQEAQEGVAALL